MKITPILNNTSFTSSRRTTYQNLGTKKKYVRPYYSHCEKAISSLEGKNPNCYPVKIVNSNFTSFFRNDITDWGALVEQLDNSFTNAPKVNVYDFGCSDGSETYSLIIALMETLGEEKAQKYFPIKAYDKDGYIVEKANSGQIECTTTDYESLLEYTNDNVEKYFDILRENREGVKTLQAKDILTDKVTFEKQSYADGLENIEKENSLILSRNFLRYLGRSEIVKATYILRDLDQSSRVVIGGFDTKRGTMTPAFLKLAGFEDCGNFVYRPKSESQRINREVMPYYGSFFSV